MSLTASRPLPPTYPRELKTLGDHLRKKRLDLGLLQREVALRLGVDTDAVTNWEKNRFAPRLHLIPRIIGFLGYVPFQPEGKGLGEQIVEIRRMLGVRQEQLARQVGVDQSTLKRWERLAHLPAGRVDARLRLLLQELGLGRCDETIDQVLMEATC